MPVHKVELIPGGVRVYTDTQTLFEGKSRDYPGERPEKIAAMKTELQDFLDTRQPRSSLPLDDPDKIADPGRADLFWDGTDLVGRGVIVTDVTITGTEPDTEVSVSLRRVPDAARRRGRRRGAPSP